MRVLHFYQTYKTESFGGVEQVIGSLCSGSSAYGITSSVLTLSKQTDDLVYDNHQVHRVKIHLSLASTRFSLSAFRRFSNLAQSADIIHYHFPWPFMDLVHFYARPKCPTVVTYHSDILRQKYLYLLYQPLMWRFLSNVNHIVATSPNYLESSPVLQHFKEKTSVIPLGLDKQSYLTPSQKKQAYWHKRLGTKFFLFVGVLRYYKGLHTLLEAAKGTTFPIIIVGDGPMKAELQRKKTELNLEKVQFLGALGEEDKIILLQLCHAVVFPSHLRTEAFGLSLLEGAMFGKPMISSDIGTGTSYINQHMQTGLVIPPEQPQALRQAMQHLWTNEEQAQSFGKAAYQRYEQQFTAKQMVGSYAALYHRLLNTAQKNKDQVQQNEQTVIS
ncbi:MAG: glycosyltransferase family 4 protein [Pseudomonadota bacterium]